MKINGFAAVVLVLAFLAVGVALSGWLVMLAAGILFNAGVIPASLGFGDSIWLGLIIGFFTAGSAAGSSK
jgi:hypothetical protein